LRADKLTLLDEEEASIAVPVSAGRTEEGSEPPRPEPPEAQAEEQPHCGTYDQADLRRAFAGVQRRERTEQREGGDEEDQALHEAKGFPHSGSVIVVVTG
jgi:hypothetical protein